MATLDSPGASNVSPLATPANNAPSPEFLVLVFSKTKGYRHASIPAGIKAIQELAASSRSSSPSPSFSVHATEDAIVFNPSTLAQYRVIVFLQVSGEFLDNDIQLGALKGFVRDGGGIIGVHCAATGLPSSEWYAKLIGGVFLEHPEPQKGRVVVEDGKHPAAWAKEMAAVTRQPSTEMGPDEFEWFDEWYNFASNPRDQEGVRVLMSVRESSYQGGTMGTDHHPVAWCQELKQGGRSFYTALGHFDEAFADSSFMAQIRNAITWTSGLGVAEAARS